MQFGLCLPIAGVCADPRVLVDLGRRGEAAGWDGVFLEDYIVDPRSRATCDPWVALAGIATVTSRVRLGTLVTPLARRRPWKVAREVTTLDWLSSGRAVLGVGAGDWRDPSWPRFGEEADLRRRGELLDLALSTIASYWQGDLEPRPLQRPRIPIWVGGAWPRRRPVERAARWDGSVLGWKSAAGEGEVLITPQDLREQRTAIRRLRGDDSTGFDYVVGGRERSQDVDSDRALVRDMAREGATWWLEYAEVGRPLAQIEAMVDRGPLRIDP
jgi:alkanesulfonate monooxygenase SsuD/methylene tetrahydromethanopterin reductase-like flavin-dependent oxidoreductase (luciferase family)